MSDDWYKTEHRLRDGTIYVEGMCKKCGVIGRSDIVMGPFGPHYAKAVCPECKTFIK